MKLLFDENLSPQLALRLLHEFPGSTHVRQVGLRGAGDQQIWKYARETGFALVSKDTDFRKRSLVEGHPPKVVLLSIGNAGTAIVEGMLLRERDRLETFEQSAETSCLVLS